jgi:hypothetical protein
MSATLTRSSDQTGAKTESKLKSVVLSCRFLVFKTCGGLESFGFLINTKMFTTFMSSSSQVGIKI